MDDKELADRVVALGIGFQLDEPFSLDGVGFYHVSNDFLSDGLCAELFVRDWQVAGPMLFKALIKCGYMEGYAAEPNSSDFCRDIIEACCEALDAQS